MQSIGSTSVILSSLSDKEQRASHIIIELRLTNRQAILLLHIFTVIQIAL
jgi:hypothetical protein